MSRALDHIQLPVFTLCSIWEPGFPPPPIKSMTWNINLFNPIFSYFDTSGKQRTLSLRQPVTYIRFRANRGQNIPNHGAESDLFASLVTSVHRIPMQVSSGRVCVDCQPTSPSWRHCILHLLDSCIHKSIAWFDSFKRRPALHACVTRDHV
jgi:hypothetical protein